MEKYKPKEKDFVGIIKKQFKDFINKSKSIGDVERKLLLKEIGDNFHDDRFDGSKFIQDAVGYSVGRWNQNNFELAQLWKEIAINNAKVGDYPHEVANEVVEEFKKQFDCEE